MGYSNTTKLALRKDDGNESIVNWRDHNNSNLDLIDTTVGNLVDAINNAKLLLGQLGYDQNGDPIVDADTARDTLDAAQSENAAGSLYDAEQAIGVNAGNIATNASAISSLQDSVDQRVLIDYVNWGTTISWYMPRGQALVLVNASTICLVWRNGGEEGFSASVLVGIQSPTVTFNQQTKVFTLTISSDSAITVYHV